jgi:CspA family cold shock protein
MNYRDTFITCQECGKQFVFTVEKQRKMGDRGLEIVLPDTCPACSPQGQAADTTTAAGATRAADTTTYGGRLHGRIKWFSQEKGYGFIVTDGGGELFCHRNEVSLTLEGTFPPLDEGQEILYEVEDTPKGPQAVHVTPYPA